MEEDNYETTNIHSDWLKNISNQLNAIQSMQRTSKEGCESLADYLQIPFEMRGVVIPDTMYKNMRFLTLEMNILIDNLEPILEDGTKELRKKLLVIINVMDKRNLFLNEKIVNKQLVEIQILPLLDKVINELSNIKSDIIKKIGYLLYIKAEDKKEW